jgi:sugar lactone lactonase YvrE
VIFDTRGCALGEGPLWHPERQQLFWFDITGQRLLSRDGETPLEWRFDEPVSAAGWIDLDTLLVASASGLWRFELATGARHLAVPLESDNPRTRSNDGRADPWGGFWIGTMGRSAEPGKGAIYRYFEGRLRKLVGGLTIPNAICFAPNRRDACFADTATHKVMRVALDTAGWPTGAPEVFLDLTAEASNPDGAVFDSEGMLWLALWGEGAVQAFAADGSPTRRIEVTAAQTTCPAFGGADFSTLYVTSARQGLSDDTLRAVPQHGMTFAVNAPAKGLPEPRVIP